MKSVYEYLSERVSMTKTVSMRDDLELFASVSSGDLEKTKELLASGANPDVRDRNGETPLFTTANLDIIKVLAEAGADFKHKDNMGYNAMMQVVRNLRSSDRMDEYISTMLHYGSDFFNISEAKHTIFDIKGNVAFEYAVNHNIKNKFPKGTKLIPWNINNLSAEQVKKLIELGYELDYEEILHKVNSENYDMFEVLLDNAPKKYPKAFDRFASAWNPPERTVRLFVKHGYKLINKHSRFGITKKLQQIQSKIEAKDSSVLFELIEDKDIDNFQKAIDEGLDFTVLKDVYTPMLYAIEKNRIDFVKLMIKYKLGLKAKSPKGLTPLIASVMKNNIEIAEMLLDAKVNINDKTKEGGTAFFWACKAGNLDMIKMLKDRGAKTDITITAPNGRKYSPYDIAELSTNKLEVTKYLDSIGVTPAHQ